MVETPSIESLRQALAPVEALRGEQSQLETWVRESFSTMDALHGELSDWQRDLTRQQALLDQREAALADLTQAHEAEAVAKLEQQLAQARDETRQLEDENSEQLQALEELDRQLAIVKAELRMANKHADELSRNLSAELQALRRLLEWQGTMLDQLTGSPAEHVEESIAVECTSTDCIDEMHGDATQSQGTADVAELRRRANSRRAGQRQPS
jgi:chromosome segregation ATPase